MKALELLLKKKFISIIIVAFTFIFNNLINFESVNTINSTQTANIQCEITADNEKTAQATTGIVYEVQPGDDYQLILLQLKPGDEMVFQEGTYENATMRIRNSGTPEQPIKIRGYGEGQDRPVFEFDTNTTPIEVWADNIIISEMEFHVHRGGNTIRISANSGETRSNVTVQNSVFRYTPNVAIDSNRREVYYNNIKVVNNAFLEARSTVLYFGAHNGSSPHTGLVVERNYIDAAQIDNPNIIGYGMETKINVKGSIIRNNIVVGSQGPGIMVYGANSLDPIDANVVEGNIVTGARNSPGILVGAGPSVVRNNVTAGNPGGGISVYDYQNRGLFHQVVVSNNTSVIDDTHGLGFTMPEYYIPQNVTIEDNKVFYKPEIPAFSNLPAEDTGWLISGNEKVLGDTEFEGLIESFKASRPNDQSLQMDIIMPQVWQHLNRLNQGPLEKNEIKKLFENLIQTLEE